MHSDYNKTELGLGKTQVNSSSSKYIIGPSPFTNEQGEAFSTSSPRIMWKMGQGMERP